MALNITLLAASLLVATVAAAGVAADDSGKITICHIPPGQPERAHTERVARSAWSAHQAHGDHKGTCTEADKRPAAQPTPPPPTRLALYSEGDGDVYGDAVFRVEVANLGSAAGSKVHVEGQLEGDGTWRVRAPSGVSCSAKDSRLTCDFTRVPAGAEVTLRLTFDGRLAVCDEVGIDLYMSSANDSSTGDNRAQTTVMAGACSPLDEPASAPASLAGS